VGVSTAVGLVALVGGVVLVVVAADVFVDGLLGVGRRLGVAPFVLTVALSGFETENLAAGIATNAKGLPGAAAGTFLGGVTFLALGVAGLGGLISPMRVELPARFAAWTALAPLPLLVFAIGGTLSRPEGGVLVLWFVVALVGAARSGRNLLAGEAGEEHERHVESTQPRIARFGSTMLPLCSRVVAEPIAGTLAGLQPFAPKCRALAGALLTRCAYVHSRACGGNLWRGQDSNLRRQSQRVYSASPLTAREPRQGDDRF
jgi:Ca2+/Na+ antiporter